jgi:hypothetical protein
MKETEKKVDELNRIAPHQNGYKYRIDFASCYGGYRLVSVNPKNGGHNGAFGESSIAPRMPRKEFIAYLNGLLNGLKYNNLK